MKTSSVPLIVGAVLLLAVLGGVFALAWHQTIPGGEAVAVAVSVITLAGTAFTAHSGFQAGANAASPAPPALPADPSPPAA